MSDQVGVHSSNCAPGRGVGPPVIVRPEMGVGVVGEGQVKPREVGVPMTMAGGPDGMIVENGFQVEGWVVDSDGRPVDSGFQVL